MALCDSHSGSHWLSLPLSGILWPSLAHYCSLILRIQPLIGSQGPCSALIADATMTHFLPSLVALFCPFWVFFGPFLTIFEAKTLFWNPWMCGFSPLGGGGGGSANPLGVNPLAPNILLVKMELIWKEAQCSFSQSNATLKSYNFSDLRLPC